MIKIERPRNPRYISEDGSAIDIDVYVAGLGDITLSCHENDKEVHVVELLARVHSGEFGPIAAAKGSPIAEYLKAVGELNRLKKILADQTEKSMAQLPLDYSKDEIISMIKYRNALLEWKEGDALPKIEDFE